MDDNSCSCKAFILSWKAERPRLYVDLGSLSQGKVSIPGQTRHINVAIQNVIHIKLSKHLFWAFKLIAEHVASFHLSYSYRQLCYHNLTNLVSLAVFGTFRHSKINQSDCLTPLLVPG